MNSSLSEVFQALHTGAGTLVKYVYVGFNSLFGEGVESRSPLPAQEIRAAGDTGNLCSPLGIKHFKALQSLKLGKKKKSFSYHFAFGTGQNDPFSH